MSKNNYTEKQEKIARFAKAIAHPARISILQMLANESCCYHGDMSELLPIAKSTLSQHLKELKDAELIKGETDPPLIKYCINEENLTLMKELFQNLFTEINSTQEGCCS